jgi:hypothetical protein
MDGEMVDALNKHDEIFKNLGDREPQTVIEAQAVLENIRAEKGHLDAETLRELHSLRAQTQERLLRIVQLKRETEAAYTTK